MDSTQKKIDNRTTAGKIQKAGNASGQSRLTFAKRQPGAPSAPQQAPSGGGKRAAESAEAEPSSKRQASTPGSSKQQSITIDSDDSDKENDAKAIGKGVATESHYKGKGKGRAVDSVDARPPFQHIDGREDVRTSSPEEVHDWSESDFGYAAPDVADSDEAQSEEAELDASQSEDSESDDSEPETQRLISDVVTAVIEGLSNGDIEMAMLVREYLISRNFEADIVSAEVYQSLRSEVLDLLALDEPATKEGLLAIGGDADNRQGVYANVITTKDDSFGFYIGGAAAIPAGRKKVAGLKARMASHKQQLKSKPSRHYNFWRGEGKSHKFVILALFDVEVPQGLVYFVEAICTVLFGTWDHTSFRSLRPATLGPLSDVAIPLNDASPLCTHPSHLPAAEELIQLTADEYTAKVVQGCPVQRGDTVRQLLSKERQPHQENDMRLTEAFEQFARQEVALSGQKVEHLVRPSGRLTSPLAILLHWPTFSASRPDNGEVADPTNGCLARVLKKLDSATDVLMADYYCRRANKVPKSKSSDSAVPMDAWSSELRAMHEGFTEWIIRSSQAKVWLVLGKANEQRIKRCPGLKPLRILVNGITIHGALEGNDEAATRVFIFGPHPETLFKPDGRARSATLSDLAYNLAISAAGLELRKPHYFKSWASLFPNKRAPRESDEGKSSLDMVLIETRYEASGLPPLAYGDLPAAIIRWLNREGYTTKEAAEALITGEQKSIVAGVKNLMQLKGKASQRKSGENLKQVTAMNKEKRLGGRYAPYIRDADPSKGEPARMELLCKSCPGSRRTIKWDNHPTYEISTDLYIARDSPCSACQADTGRKRAPNRQTKPADRRIGYIRYGAFVRKHPR